jgi:hypothetical protein
MIKCQKCGFPDDVNYMDKGEVRYCPDCGRVYTPIQQSRIEELERELAATKLKWQTGQPDEEGRYYLVRKLRKHADPYPWKLHMYANADIDWFWQEKGIQWSGPLEQPSDGE